ncbi:MAG: tRNA lysidine(34) synthetase TilS [Firmicutes bacterium]|nr:tRNA lysidine(34) synthetase TilS [Bacillota bacterium]
MNAEDRVKKTIQEQALLCPGDAVLLALSGGPDSLCLLHILRELSGPLHLSLRALHVNHLLRGEAADEDEAWVRAHCAQLQIPLEVVRADVRSLARQQGCSEEEMGRQVRYEALKRSAAEDGAKIALAHNRSDQAETVLLRLLRGTGVHGLGAMEYRRSDGVIRPLLDTPREEIEEYCQRKGLAPRTDATNSSPAYTRNRLRLQLLPLLEKDYNPSVQEALIRLAASARCDEAYLQQQAEDALSAICPDAAARARAGTVILCARQLAALHPAIRGRVIATCFRCLGLQEELSFVHRNAIEVMLESGAGGKQLQLPDGYTAELYAGQLKLQAPHLPADRQTPLLPQLTATPFAAGEAPSFRTLGPDARLVDSEKLAALPGTLQVRFRRPGDRIVPLGMTGSKKLKDYLIDRRVPREERDRIPLLCKEDQVLWVLGYDMSQLICVDNHTKISLLLEMKYTL